ncbi:MAG TPA: uroporphyrinogen-III synthase, partial [Thermoanaerobaculia bacterium]|nr:uroporphyrinogen-III synthase [Thermoanaerobaculia bacterium]
MSAAGAVLPLAGLRVVVTRAVHQAEGTARAFRLAGAEVELLPLLELTPPADRAPLASALASLADYDWVVFTSANAVERVLGGPRAPEVAGAGAAFQRSAVRVGSLPSGLRVASVGEATSEALRSLGIEPDLEPDDARAEGVAAVLGPRVAGGARVLLPQAADARPVL